MPGNTKTPEGRDHHRWALPIRDLGLAIAGSPLEPILVEFEAELLRADPSLARVAVEELNRFDGPAKMVVRRAGEDALPITSPARNTARKPEPWIVSAPP